MLKQAKSSFAWLLGLPFLSQIALADETKRWGVNMTQGVTDVSREIYGLHMDIFWWCVAIGVVVFGVMIYTMIAHRKANGAKAANFHESTALEILWTVVPIIILVIMVIPATKTLIKVYDTGEPDLDVVITGYQWKWKYEYLNQDVSFFSSLSTPKDEIYNLAPKGPNYLLEVDNELVIPTKQKVRFLITANDVIHAWWVPDLAVKKDAIPGFINESWTYIDEPGIYRGQCAELCGKDHGFMPIVVRAVPQAEFDEWMAKKREAAAAIAEAAKQTLSFDELYAQGEAVYQKHCAACHQPDGKGIPPTFPAIAGSPIANGDMGAHIDRVLNGGQGMPPFGEQLTPVESAAVITFQRNAFGNNTGSEVQPIDIVNFQQGL
ncbi:cytochrome c oxidase subunit II [Simiduia sp. 21SJ11W-1]|uniref:cytochrome c oxidase subunit II n=1 Tax=Simiduia sp. 21SJ11W-1 TaxID=2909669 RepID=UPI00209E1234|nr:cytochrome c oxidase subunit II [Simiduia sp. 21SJ11W-1]UTA47911.1 cytochrome c oxidase subunit II [Simiduia sp. 21SJ11W-1]